MENSGGNKQRFRQKKCVGLTAGRTHFTIHESNYLCLVPVTFDIFPAFEHAPQITNSQTEILNTFPLLCEDKNASSTRQRGR